MRRYLWALFLSATLGWGGEWSYRVYSPILGTLGTIDVKRTQSTGRYRVDIRARTRGVAALLTGKRRESYRSKGVVRGGRYLSRNFRVQRQMKSKRQIDTYRVDVAARKVFKRKLRWKKGRLDRNSSKTLPYFTREDLVALYHNRVPPLLKSPPGTRWRGYAVGAEKIKGIVTVSRADEATERKERRRLGVGREATILIVSTPEKLLGKRNRRLIMAIDPEGALLKARLVALPVVGEIFVERVMR